MAHATLIWPVSLRSTQITKLPCAKHVPWLESKISAARQIHPILCSHSYSDSDPQYLWVFIFVCILNHLVNAKCLIFFVIHVLRNLWEQQPEKFNSFSLPIWKRCLCNTSSVCNEHSDQISMLKNVYSLVSICRQVQSFALKRIAKQLCECLAQGAETCCWSRT